MGNRIDRTIYLHLLEYQNESDEKQLKQFDDWATRAIKEMEENIRLVKEYRKGLYEHTQKLQEMESYLKLELIRSKKSWGDGKVYYYLTINRKYPDNENMVKSVLSETYPGTERSAAFKRYNQLLKEYPGIIAEKHVEKSMWER